MLFLFLKIVNNFKILNGSIVDKKSEGIASAHDNHMNFLRIGKYLFLPCYDIPEDRDAWTAIRKARKNLKIIRVDVPGLNSLAGLGEVLNCISWAF